MDKYIATSFISIKEAMKLLNKYASKILFVQDDDRLKGSLSDGDIRRAIVEGVDLSSNISRIMNTKTTFLYEDYDLEKVRDIMLKKKFEAIPILNKNHKIIDILFWNMVFSEHKEVKARLDYPVVIMAGGKGTRLDPFTKILPKPLIPIGEKPIIEIIMDEFGQYGINEFYISINHKAKMIKAFFEDLYNDYTIRYIEETKPLGTAGSLKFIAGIFTKPFFVSNCDIIIKDDYSKLMDFHLYGQFDLTIVASMQHHVVPYGVCEIENGGMLKTIIEKPEYDFLVNTGMYICNPSCLKIIPDNTFYHITDLIAELKSNNKKVGVFPVSEKVWIDVGQWSEYKNAIDKLNNVIHL